MRTLMNDWLSTISIVDGPAFVLSFVLTGALLILLGITRQGVRARVRHFRRLVLAAAIAGAVVGAVLTWLLSDVINVFGVSLTWVVRIADTLAFAGFAVALVNVVTTRWWRALIALVTAALTAWCLFLTINVDFGQYPTLGDAVGTTYRDTLALPEKPQNALSITEWTAPDDLPEEGLVGTVDIAARAADFAPRPAAVYLPPAALTASAPELPVVIALSGQPGTPSDVFSAGGVDQMMDSIAQANGGLAPIVVVPDQLGDPSINPMCVDGALGDSQTYLVEDVRAWITEHFAVRAEPSGWTIAGFSQGGTCAIQLGAAYPEIFGSIIDVSGEEAPTLGSHQRTIDEGFGGDAKAYEAATPLHLLAENEPFTDSTAIFVAGENDAQYSAYMDTVSAAAERADMTTIRAVSPGTGHDWNTARYGFSLAFDALLTNWGLTR